MKMILLTLAIFSASAGAAVATTVDENFTATFSHYDAFDQMITCVPGFRGGFPTQDMIFIKAHAVDTGLEISKEFMGFTDEGIKNDPPRGGPSVTRPYDEGCKPALELLKAELEGKEVVELTVHRTIQTHPETSPRVRRKLNGDVVSVQYVTNDQSYETFSFVLGGVTYSVGQIMNGKAVVR